jgi:hypothetical protein
MNLCYFISSKNNADILIHCSKSHKAKTMSEESSLLSSTSLPLWDPLLETDVPLTLARCQAKHFALDTQCMLKKPCMFPLLGQANFKTL